MRRRSGRGDRGAGGKRGREPGDPWGKSDQRQQGGGQGRWGGGVPEWVEGGGHKVAEF